LLDTFYSAQGYPEPLRRIRYYDAERDKRLIFLTHDFILPATIIAALYKSRWRVELFFQMDKAAPSNKVLLRNEREHCETIN
jgi:IS4 transposase